MVGKGRRSPNIFPALLEMAAYSPCVTLSGLEGSDGVAQTHLEESGTVTLGR